MLPAMKLRHAVVFIAVHATLQKLPFMGMIILCWQVGGVAVLHVRGNFMFDAASHRDFLGACLGTGIDRSKVGDVLINGEQGAHIMVAPELVEYLTINLTAVRIHIRYSTESMLLADSSGCRSDLDQAAY